MTYDAETLPRLAAIPQQARQRACTTSGLCRSELSPGTRRRTCHVSITSGMKPIELHACFSDLMNRDAWGGILTEHRR